MEYDGLEFPDAIEELASMQGMQVPREQSIGGSANSQPAVSKDLFELMNQIARFYESNLKSAPHAVEYLKGRGLTGEVVKRFNIGYAPSDWDQVRRRFGTSRDHEQLLISGGMLITRDNGRGVMIVSAIASCSRSVTSVAVSSVSVAGCWVMAPPST